MLLFYKHFGRTKFRICIVKGPAKLLGAWTKDNNKEISFTSSGLENFKIYQGQQGAILTVNYKNTKEVLAQTSESSDDRHGIKVYEYDFDNDKDLEYIVISSDKPMDINVQIYKISKGLTKLIGSFNAQRDIIVSRNFISFPFGGQGLEDEYYYRNDAFYELVYHNPRRK
jgi:hypothetical protein